MVDIAAGKPQREPILRELIRGNILSLTISIPEAMRIFSPFIGGWIIERYTLIPAMRIGYTICFVTVALVGLTRIKYLEETIETVSLNRGIVDLP